MNSSPATLRSRQKQQTKTEIVKAAADLFVRDGIQAVSVEAICRKAGVSRGTFFNYFAQKELVLPEMLAHRVARMEALLNTFGSEASPSLQDVTGLFLQFAEENERLGPQSKPILATALAHQVCHSTMAGIRSRMLQATSEYLKRLCERKSLRLAYGADEVAGLLFSTYLGTCMEWVMVADTEAGWLVKALSARYAMLLPLLTPASGGVQ